ncbi:MAG: serine/threonine-protein kinase [Vicinamibacterales bacterium]
MHDDEARLIWELYAAALKHEPAARGAYLERACPDSAVRARVSALLDSHGLEFGETETSTGHLRSPGAADTGHSLVGRQIGTYVIQRELGRGGMGIVYLAHDLRLGRTVAIKALSPAYSHSPDVRQRLLNEAKMAAALTHPGIATIYALEEIQGELYLACEYVPGAPLRALVASGPLPIEEVIDIGIQLARALAEAHTKGIVHRDIKPENVIKTPSGVIKVLDFGLARAEYATRQGLTQPGMIVGTPAYLAPEQALGKETDFRTDIFTLGLLLYELASGTNPFAAGTITATIGRIVNDDPPPLSAVQPHSFPALDRIVHRCLRKDPLDRYRSTQEIIGDLERLRAERSRHASSGGDAIDGIVPETAPPRSRQWLVNHHVIMSVVYVLLLYPAWYARGWLAAPLNSVFMLALLGAAAAGASLRLHLWFTAITFPQQLGEQQASTERWTRVCDVVFAAVQIGAALGISGGHPEFAMLFVAASVAILVASFVIEPATVRAALRGPSA